MGGLILFRQKGRLKQGKYLGLLAVFPSIAYLEYGFRICLAVLVAALDIYYIKKQKMSKIYFLVIHII